MRRSDPATGHQLHTIALLCVACGIHEPLEEEPMTIGEAGKLIRRLGNEKQNIRKDAHTSEVRKDLW